MNFDAHLVRILNQIQHIRQLKPDAAADRERALAESLEALRAVTRYRGLLKNVAEVTTPPRRVR